MWQGIVRQWGNVSSLHALLLFRAASTELIALFTSDCCDGSDEAKGVCENECLSSAKVHMQELEKKLSHYSKGLQMREEYVLKWVLFGGGDTRLMFFCKARPLVLFAQTMRRSYFTGQQRRSSPGESAWASLTSRSRSTKS
jgi:hypothetical protein